MKSIIPFCALTVACLDFSSPCGAAPGALVDKVAFGQSTNGIPVELYVLRNSKGMVAKAMNYGAILVELHVPDRQGNIRDVVLGLDSGEKYLKGHPALGSTIGRYANRIGNARFTLNGKTYELAKNNGIHHIHGGRKGFDKQFWQAQAKQTSAGVAVTFSYLSVDGEEGYPGNLKVSVTYTLGEDNSLRLDYQATCDQDTPINLSNHSYFNLAGADSGDILGQVAQIFADHYTVVDDALIPTGEIAPVKGTPLDFTLPTPIGARIKELPKTGGYDHNYVLNSGGKELALAARVYESKSGRVLEVFTTEPGVQFFTANRMKNVQGKQGAVYGPHQAFCLETQHFPDAINKPKFPSPVLKAGATFNSTTIFKFSIK